MLIVLTTVPDNGLGESLAEAIVKSKLAACVQILPQMLSVYAWEGNVVKDQEHLLLIKTLPEKWEELRDFITANHSYETPEIVAIDAETVAEPYRKWLEAAL